MYIGKSVPPTLVNIPCVSIQAILQAILHVHVSCLWCVIKLHGFLNTPSETVKIVAV